MSWGLIISGTLFIIVLGFAIVPIAKGLVDFLMETMDD